MDIELKDHLGNVRVVVGDRLLATGTPANITNEADVLSYNNYYPFGMLQPGRNYSSNTYRFGFNGKEMDNDVTGNTGVTYDYGFRIYDTRVARFLSVDPLTKDYPWYTPYQFAGNKPIWAIDLDGLEELITIYSPMLTRKISVLDLTTEEGVKEAIRIANWAISNKWIDDYAYRKYSKVIKNMPEKKIGDRLWLSIVPKDGNICIQGYDENGKLINLYQNYKDPERSNYSGKSLYDPSEDIVESAGFYGKMSYTHQGVKNETEGSWAEETRGSETVRVKNSTYVVPNKELPSVSGELGIFVDFRGGDNSTSTIKYSINAGTFGASWDEGKNRLELKYQTPKTPIQVEPKTKIEENTLMETK